MGEYISVRGISQEGILALPNPVGGYRHESFGICEYHNGLVMSEGVFKSQTRCRKFGPVGRAATDASPDPAAPAFFGIVSEKPCSHSCGTFRTVHGIYNPRKKL